MKEMLMILVGMVIVVGSAILLGIILYFIADKIISFKIKKRKQNHPALFEMIEELNKRLLTLVNFTIL